MAAFGDPFKTTAYVFYYEKQQNKDSHKGYCVL